MHRYLFLFCLEHRPPKKVCSGRGAIVVNGERRDHAFPTARGRAGPSNQASKQNVRISCSMPGRRPILLTAIVSRSRNLRDWTGCPRELRASCQCRESAHLLSQLKPTLESSQDAATWESSHASDTDLNRPGYSMSPAIAQHSSSSSFNACSLSNVSEFCCSLYSTLRPYIAEPRTGPNLV
ncbi:hypothetical protein LY76DRAFT_174434 [Colletotrichum caudatum]|nr:hypothetical protein LY76DRAFT_174434 [Colletotrichum caudatum]